MIYNNRVVPKFIPSGTTPFYISDRDFILLPVQNASRLTSSISTYFPLRIEMEKWFRKLSQFVLFDLINKNEEGILLEDLGKEYRKVIPGKYADDMKELLLSNIRDNKLTVLPFENSYRVSWNNSIVVEVKDKLVSSGNMREFLNLLDNLNKIESDDLSYLEDEYLDHLIEPEYLILCYALLQENSFVSYYAKLDEYETFLMKHAKNSNSIEYKSRIMNYLRNLKENFSMEEVYVEIFTGFLELLKQESDDLKSKLSMEETSIFDLTEKNLIVLGQLDHKDWFVNYSGSNIFVRYRKTARDKSQLDSMIQEWIAEGVNKNNLNTFCEYFGIINGLSIEEGLIIQSLDYRKYLSTNDVSFYLSGESRNRIDFKFVLSAFSIIRY